MREFPIALPSLSQGKRVAVPLCGGNVDTPVLGRVLERGLAADGRLFRFEAVCSDRPGGINSITTIVARAGGKRLSAVYVVGTTSRSHARTCVTKNGNVLAIPHAAVQACFRCLFVLLLHSFTLQQ